MPIPSGGEIHFELYLSSKSKDPKRLLESAFNALLIRAQDSFFQAKSIKIASHASRVIANKSVRSQKESAAFIHHVIEFKLPIERLVVVLRISEK